MATFQEIVSEIVTFDENIGANLGLVTVLDGFTIAETDGLAIETLSPQVIKKVVPAPISEDVDFNDPPPTHVYHPRPTISETVTFSETQEPFGTFGVTVSDTVDFNDTATVNGLFGAIVSEGLAFRTNLALEDAIYECWVVNSKHFGLSEYLNFNFNSLVKHGDKYFGSSDDGVFELTGDTDDAFLIKAGVKTPILDFNSEFQKKVPRIYVGLRNNGDVILKTITNENIERWYTLAANQFGMGKGRVKVSKAVRSAYWQFEFVNATGDGFDLKEIQWLPVPKTRRVK